MIGYRVALLASLGVAAAGITLASAPAAAQNFSASYQFLEAVRERDGTKATELLGAPGGATLINTRDLSSGDTALHIVVARRDTVWIRFLLQRRADANIANRAGLTPLMAATQIGFVDGVQALVGGGARVNGTNTRGETPLHIAVQRRDLQTVQALLALGADATIQDSVTGKSPLDYAREDGRSAAIVAALTAPPRTAATPQAAGPN
jgi:uncharacterized protein